jgi:hypothetical protein
MDDSFQILRVDITLLHKQTCQLRAGGYSLQGMIKWSNNTQYSTNKCTLIIFLDIIYSNLCKLVQHVLIPSVGCNFLCTGIITGITLLLQLSFYDKKVFKYALYIHIL